MVFLRFVCFLGSINCLFFRRHPCPPNQSNGSSDGNPQLPTLTIIIIESFSTFVNVNLTFDKLIPPAFSSCAKLPLYLPVFLAIFSQATVCIAHQIAYPRHLSSRRKAFIEFRNIQFLIGFRALHLCFIRCLLQQRIKIRFPRHRRI